MGWLRKGIIAGGAVVGGGSLLCFGIGLFLPSDVALSTTRRVTASADALHPFLTTHEGVSTWWQHAASSAPGPMPEMSVVHVAGPTEGPGLVIAFEAGGMQAETWTLDAVGPDAVTWTVDFGIFSVERTFGLVPEQAGGTLVRWDERGHITNPFYRWFPILMPEEEVIANFDLALAALDQVSAPAEAP